MGKLKLIFFGIFIVILVGGGYYAYQAVFKPKVAGIYIESEPISVVYINGEQVGRTPFTDRRKPGEVVIKLVPESFDRPLAPYETLVTLVPGVETVIQRSFGESNDLSHGSVVSFEQIEKSSTELVVASYPDNSKVEVDGDNRGFSPFNLNNIEEGLHKIQISSNGFISKSIEVKAHKGYRLTVLVSLSKDANVVQEPQVEEVVEEIKKVQILDTPVGFLRVRGEPSTLGVEVGQVTPGEEYVLIEVDEETGWFKIEFDEEKEGWVSDEYAELVVEEKVEAESEGT